VLESCAALLTVEGKWEDTTTLLDAAWGLRSKDHTIQPSVSRRSQDLQRAIGRVLLALDG